MIVEWCSYCGWLINNSKHIETCDIHIVRKVPFTKVSFEQMLKTDGEIICKHWITDKFNKVPTIDLRKPMLFNEFLWNIGIHLTSMNCKSIFEQAEWYVIDDGIHSK